MIILLLLETKVLNTNYNVDFLMKQGYNFMLPVPFGNKWVEELIEEVVPTIHLDGKMIENEQDELVYAITKTDTNFRDSGKTVYKHVFYDATRREASIRSFNKKLRKLKDDVTMDKVAKGDLDFCKKYFIVDKDSKSGKIKNVRINGEAYKEFENNYSCTWILLTDTESDVERALSLYKNRNSIELHFDDLKNHLDCKRLRVNTEKGMRGKMFICFLSLIMINEFKNEVKAIPGKDRHYWSWKELLKKSTTYSRITFEGNYEDAYSVPTKAQRGIFGLLGIEYYWQGKFTTDGVKL